MGRWLFEWSGWVPPFKVLLLVLNSRLLGKRGIIKQKKHKKGKGKETKNCVDKPICLCTQETSKITPISLSEKDCTKTTGDLWEVYFCFSQMKWLRHYCMRLAIIVGDSKWWS